MPTSGKQTESAIRKPGIEFQNLDLSFHQTKNAKADDFTFCRPGKETEAVLPVCVFKRHEIGEPFHRQDFFFINYAYRNSYDALSSKYDNLITVRENETISVSPKVMR